ncbi:uncharacterized protein LOC127604988 [Hippocampus zosterae]|uniref:uncharacterized protein LOC127604988 n=1 Tax=Hippocampus zosterae TaxID=109293 RepID=UPI00223E3590|nr:uncharacterized protein LOC127604988 [Hippocampus zosterae]
MARILIGVIAALACFMLVESLTCNECSFGLLGFCVSSSTVGCSTNTSQCFTGKATFTSISSLVGFNTQGCIEQANCNMTTNATLLGVTYEAKVECCSTDRCNPAQTSGAPSVKATSAAAIMAAVLWGSLLCDCEREWFFISPFAKPCDYGPIMINFWKTAILLTTTVAAVHCLICRQCPVSILDLCLFGSDITCNNATQSCYRGTAQFNSTGAIRLEIRGCLDSDLCGDVLTGNLFGNGYTASFECCNTDRCNGATSVQLSLTMAVCGALFSLWAMQ